MKFWEAMKALQEGERVRAIEDPKGQYLIKILHQILLEADGKSYDKSHSPLGTLILQEWELYEEPARLLSFKEMIEAIKKGKICRRILWSHLFHSIIWLDNSPTMNHEFRDIRTFSLEEIEATDWFEIT